MSKGKYSFSYVVTVATSFGFETELDEVIKYYEKYDVEIHYACNKELYTALLIFREKEE